MEQLWGYLANLSSIDFSLVMSYFVTVVFIAIPAFLFVLTIVVFFHELGHFLVARWCGVQVETFSIGFGKEIFGWNDSKGTRWKVSWIPLGGYVKFLGDQNAASTPDGEQLQELTAEQRSGSLHYKNLWQKAAIVAAGPIASFLLGIIIFAGTFTIYGYGYFKPIVGNVVQGSAAEQAGFKVGDQIKSMNGREIRTFLDLKSNVQISGDTVLNFVVLRNGQEIQLSAKAREEKKRDRFGGKQRLLGIGSSQDKAHRVFYRVDPFTAVGLAVDRTVNLVSLTMRYLTGIATAKVSAEQLTGPVGTATFSWKIFQDQGFIGLINLAGFLSVAIGLFNLFPIPVLDGGHLVFIAMEGILGKTLSVRAQEIAMSLGFVLLVVLMLFVTRLDIERVCFVAEWCKS